MYTDDGSFAVTSLFLSFFLLLFLSHFFLTSPFPSHPPTHLLCLSTMDSSQNSISGDLPIRLARPKQLKPVQGTKEPAQTVPKPAIDPNFLEDEAASQID